MAFIQDKLHTSTSPQSPRPRECWVGPAKNAGFALRRGDVAEVGVGQAAEANFEPALGQPTPLLPIFVVVLDVVLEVRIAATHVAPDQRGEVDDVHALGVERVPRQKRMRLEHQRALGQNQLSHPHAEELDDAVVLDLRRGVVLDHLVEFVQGRVATERDPGVSGRRVEVEHRTDGVEEGFDRHRSSEDRGPRSRRELPEAAERPLGFAVGAGRLVLRSPEDRLLDVARVVECLALLVVLDRIARTGPGFLCRVGDVVGVLEDLSVVEVLDRVPGRGIRRRRTFGVGRADLEQEQVVGDRGSRRACSTSRDVEAGVAGDRYNLDDFIVVGGGVGRGLDKQKITGLQIGGRAPAIVGSGGAWVGAVDDDRSGARGERAVDLQTNDVVGLVPPSEFGVVRRFALGLAHESKDRRRTIWVPEKNGFPEILRPLIGGPVSGSPQSCNSHSWLPF